MAGVQTASDARTLIGERVRERQENLSAEDVQTARSFASAERLLGREYHGRFLIELLQNGADAWRASGSRGRSRVSIVLDDAPALLVANEGAPFPALAVIESLGHIGRSTKAAGEAIGHKGIGFKSVLEISLTPELYSGFESGQPDLAVRFDPREALSSLRAASPSWTEHVAAMSDLEGDELAAVPILRYPAWITDVPATVQELGAAGFQTVVRLPFNDELRPDADLDRDAWLKSVRDAITDVTDEILILLGTFEDVAIDDRIAAQSELIRLLPSTRTPVPGEEGTTRETVAVTRKGSSSSAWKLYRSSIADSGDLAGEVAVGLRLDIQDEPHRLIAPREGAPSAPFHLFFPTRISSGLPFLLHGYFEVNAARTGFYEGSAARNDVVLDALANTVAAAVHDTAENEPSVLDALADLLGECVPPDDLRARGFRERVIEMLDGIAWVPLEGGERGTPQELLVEGRPEIVERVLDTFSPSYVGAQTGLGLPARLIGSAGHRFLVERRPETTPDLWEALSSLCRPGTSGPWPAGHEDHGFRRLLELVSALEVLEAPKSNALLDGLRGDPKACLLPTVGHEGGRTMLPVPDPAEGNPGQRSLLVMAPTRQESKSPLLPPDVMDIAFLPDGLLDSEGLVESARPLGVRPFTVDNVLDRLRGVAGVPGDPSALLEFLWTLLVRERLSAFGTQNAVETATDFSPVEWFWCHPGHGGRSGPKQTGSADGASSAKFACQRATERGAQPPTSPSGRTGLSGSRVRPAVRSQRLTANASPPTEHSSQ